jgi:hypothetical protein
MTATSPSTAASCLRCELSLAAAAAAVAAAYKTEEPVTAIAPAFVRV